jgi:hypothetical protein
MEQHIKKRSSKSSKSSSSKTLKSLKKQKLNSENVLDKVAVKNKNTPLEKIKMQQYIINTMNNINNSSQSSFDPSDSIEYTLINYYSKRFKKSCIINFCKNWLTPSDFDKTTWSTKVNECIDKIKQCMREKGENICIAIIFSFFFRDSENENGHSNLLLFKPYKRTLEWYEPHGETFSFFGEDIIDDNNKLLIDYILQCLQNEYFPIQLITPMVTCPFIGFQSTEERSELPDLSGGGYCVLWSILIMKLALKFPNKKIEEITTELQHLYHKPINLRKLMYAFSNEISNILFKHYNITLNEFNADPKILNFEDKTITSSLQDSSASNKNIRIIRKNIKVYPEDSDSAVYNKAIAYTYPMLIRENKHEFTFFGDQSSMRINEHDALTKFKVKKTYLIITITTHTELFLKITETSAERHLYIVGTQMSTEDPTTPIHTSTSIKIMIHDIESASEVILQ